MADIIHTVAVRDAVTDLVVDRVDAGAGAGSLIYQTSGDVVVATCPFSDPAFDASGSAGGNADGLATANAITSDTNAVGGTVAKARIKDSNALEVLSCSVTATGGGGSIIVSSTVVGAGDTMQTDTLTYASMA